MAFAALDSLRRTIRTLDDTSIIKMFESFNLDSLQCTLQRLDFYRGIDRSEINELEVKITEAAWKVEDVLDSYQLALGVDKKGLEQEIRSFLTTTKTWRKKYKSVLQNSCVAEEEGDHIIHNAANSTTVGLLDLSEAIIPWLLDDKYEGGGKILSILGMAGIGKTHLARHIYHHPLIVQHFKLRLWVTIGPIDKDIKNIFVDILAQIESKPRDVFKEKDEHELRDLLLESLLDRTYLVVFDDVWSESAFSDCIAAFPHYKTEKISILITTRLCHVAPNRYSNRFGTEKHFLYECYEMPFLSNEESWKLLSQTVFAEKPFPTKLEQAGRKIAEICEGLPLLILAVADILRGLDQTEECWNKVAQKKTTTFPDAYDRIYKVLVSSYDYLPQKYKACFLYMGVFRQSQEINPSKLIQLWKFEGFSGDNYRALVELSSNNIIILCKTNFYGMISSCKLHSVYWYVCVTEARKNKLFHVLIKLTDVTNERPRRLSVQNNMLFGLKEVYDSMAATTSLTRSLLFTGEDHQYPVHICFTTMLLMKVLDALAINFYEFPNEVLNLLQLRYLTLTHNGEVPSSISKLQRLHYLFLRRQHNIKLLQRESTTYLPKEIWDLKELQYLRIMGSNLPGPSHGVELPILSRLYVNADSCTEDVLRGTPALEKLGIEIELQPEGEAENSLRCLEYTGLLYKLKSVKCVVVNPRFNSHVVAPRNYLLNLPKNLRKLSLKGLGYPWKYISAIGSLSNLKVLKLRCSAFRGPEWKIKKGQFDLLKALVLEDLDVVHWTSEAHLLSLNHLIVGHCYRLKMIPSITFSDRIEVDDCPSIVDNANPSHKVEINSSWNIG